MCDAIALLMVTFLSLIVASHRDKINNSVAKMRDVLMRLADSLERDEIRRNQMHAQLDEIAEQQRIQGDQIAAIAEHLAGDDVELPGINLRLVRRGADDS